MKILYGLPSEGMGHATRSAVVIAYLLQQDHDVEVITSDKAFDFLKQKFGDRVHRIEGFHFAFNGSEISVGKTIFQTLKDAPQKVKANWKQYFQFLRNERFDVVISDFETYAALYAKLHKIPLISLDNIQVIDRCRISIPIPFSERKDYQLAKKVVQLKVPRAHHYIISTFFDVALKKKSTTLVPSIIREAILQCKPSSQEHILIYQYAQNAESLVQVLQAFPEQSFYVYGFNREEDHGHVQFKTFSEEEFLYWFASAKAVICHGGFSFISEAVYLKKPIYSFPIAHQFEQFLNASYVQKAGYGVMSTRLEKDSLAYFLEHVVTYQVNLNAYKQDGNKALFQVLDQVLQDVKKA